MEELLESPDAAGCVARLKGLAFLETADFGEGYEGVERALRYSCAVFARRIRRCLGGSAGRFLEAYTLHYDLHNAKVLFRGSFEEGSAGEIRELYPLSTAYMEARGEDFKTPEDAVKFFEDTRLGEAARKAFEVYEAHDGDLSFYELVLDREYVKLVWEAAERVGPREGGRLREGVVLPWLGSTAVLWTLWLAEYRGMGVEEIVMLLDVPEGLLRGALVAALVEGGRPAGIAEGVKNRALAEFLGGSDLPAGLAELHRVARRFTWRTITPRRLQTRFDIVTLLTAVMRWEFVVEDALTVAGAKAMGLGKDEIAGLLATGGA